jgi:SpoVK/Ycf46/Vps4 family AAA+-type ATPase
MLDQELPDVLRYPHFSLLLPPSIKGFGFHNKKWSQYQTIGFIDPTNMSNVDELLVEHIEEISWNKNVFTDDLVLDEGKKELIQALVTVHLERTVKTKADFMTGKGEGLLILLHGGPGTGKTLTAESVAELAARPLYRVTCGDIGTDPEEVEKYLNSVLFIGSTWNCVVLLDEADVFLEERTKLDLQRNALVSVFLRVLEYYDGILILTSNRIGTFDEAFKSRVQLSLHYPPLTRKDRVRVWENFVALLENSSDTTKFPEIRQRLDSLAIHKLNGRQIRNTMNTARQLAQFKKEPLGYRHLNQAIQNVLEFEKYVTKLHDDQTDEEYAEMHGIRHSNKKRKAEEDLD